MARKNKRQADFEASLRAVFDTDQGRRALAYLKEDFLDTSAFRETTEETYYALGQQDLVKLIIGCLKDQESLENIKTVDYLGDLNYD